MKVESTMKSPPKDDNPEPNHHSYELPSEQEERYENLFEKLDVNQDGRIDIEDLTDALTEMGMSENIGHAKTFIEQSKDGSMDFADFLNYIREHEKKLLLVFKKLDINKDGRIDVSEVRKTFKRLGISIDQKEAEHILKRMDRDGSLDIDFEEWRNYLLFHSSTDLYDLMKSWRHATVLDIGDGIIVPDDFTETEMATGMWWKHLVAGGCAGIVSRTCTAPLERSRVFLQVYSKKFNNIAACLHHMLKEGGFRSLWRGNGMNILKIAPETALMFSTYEYMKHVIRGNKKGDVTTYERFVAGSCAGVFCQSLIYPLEVLKTRLTLRKTGQYESIADAFTKIYRREGMRSFYRGYLPNLLGIIPYAGIDLAVYESMKKLYFQVQDDNSEPRVMVLLACGTLSTACGQIASYPLALVRTRLQAEAVALHEKSNLTMLGIFRSILRDDGFRGLYKGIEANILKVAPAVSISYVVYECTRHLIFNWL